MEELRSFVSSLSKERQGLREQLENSCLETLSELDQSLLARRQSLKD